MNVSIPSDWVEVSRAVWDAALYYETTLTDSFSNLDYYIRKRDDNRIAAKTTDGHYFLCPEYASE